MIGAFPLANSHQIYDPKTDTWTLGGPVISGYNFATAAVTTGEYAPKRIHVFGINNRYWDLGLPVFSTQSYDPTSENWTRGTSMPTERICAGFATLNDTIYVIGGYTLIIGNKVYPSSIKEQYTPIDYIPEFQPFIILPLILIASFVAILLKKKIHKT